MAGALVKGIAGLLKSSTKARIPAATASRVAPSVGRAVAQDAAAGIDSSLLAALREAEDAVRILEEGYRNPGRIVAGRRADRLGGIIGGLEGRAAATGSRISRIQGKGFDRLNQQWDQLEEMKKRWNRVARNTSDPTRNKVVTVKVPGFPAITGKPRQIAAKIEEYKGVVESRALEARRRVGDLSNREMRDLDRANTLRDDFVRGSSGPERIVPTDELGAARKRAADLRAQVQSQTDERSQFLAELGSRGSAGLIPTTNIPKKPIGKVGKSIAIGAGGLGGFILPGMVQGVFEERDLNQQSGERLTEMIRQASDQRLAAIRAMAAMQRVQSGARQNLSNLAMQQPHVFNELVAGRELAPGVVSIGGSRAAQMARMAEVGTAMATGGFDQVAEPNALEMLSKYMGG